MRVVDPKTNLLEIQSHHRASGVYADEVLLLATALAGGIHIIVFDEANQLIYNIMPTTVTKCAIFKLTDEHYSPLQVDYMGQASAWYQKQPWAWTKMFKNHPPRRLAGGSGCHAYSSIRLKPYRSGAVALEWKGDMDQMEEGDKPAMDKQWNLKVVNAQGLSTALPHILADEPSCCVCSETNMPRADKPDTDAAGQEHGYMAIHSIAPYSGVSILVRAPYRVIEIDVPAPLQQWATKGGIIAGSILLPEGDLVAMITSRLLQAEGKQAAC